MPNLKSVHFGGCCDLDVFICGHRLCDWQDNDEIGLSDDTIWWLYKCYNSGWPVQQNSYLCIANRFGHYISKCTIMIEQVQQIFLIFLVSWFGLDNSTKSYDCRMGATDIGVSLLQSYRVHSDANLIRKIVYSQISYLELTWFFVS